MKSFYFNVTVKWNLTKSCDKRIPHKMTELHLINQSYDESLCLSYQKLKNLKISCSYSKESDLYSTVLTIAFGESILSKYSVNIFQPSHPCSSFYTK